MHIYLNFLTIEEHLALCDT